MSNEIHVHREDMAEAGVPEGDLTQPEQLDLPLTSALALETRIDADGLQASDNFGPMQEPPRLFVSYDELAPALQSIPHLAYERALVRFPNVLDLLLFTVLLILGALVSTGALGLALNLHWFGLRNAEQAAKSTGITLLTEVLWYGVALATAIPIFRSVWKRGYFDGVHWHAATAIRLRYRLVGAAVVCNLLAMIGALFLHFPEHAPVDKLFGSASDAWLIFAFGVTVAPFFEEMGFRGFLLPVIATAWDWCTEKMTDAPPRGLDTDGNPKWSVGAAIFASLVVSAPFALMHAEQVGKAWGPLLLLYCVSLILCAVRVLTRSLAASTLVHSTYNFLLFTLMYFQTDGFHHLEKM